MAKYLPGTSPPTPGTRVQGLVYGAGVASRPVYKWTYPLSRPSARFANVNARAQQLDATWHGLDAATQAAWATFAAQVNVLGADDCWPFDWPGSWELLNQLCFRQTNLNRLDDGQPVSFDVPIDGLQPYLTELAFAWDGTNLTVSTQDADPHMLVERRVAVYAARSTPGQAPPRSARGLQLVGSFQISLNQPANITTAAASLGFWNGTSGSVFSFCGFLRERGNMSFIRTIRKVTA